MKRPVRAHDWRRAAMMIAATIAPLVLQPAGISAHDLPTDVHVQMFVGPVADELQVVVRLPLISLLNINLPKRGEDFLDLGAVEPSLRDAARATADAIEIFGDDVKLGPPRLGDLRVSLPSDASFASYPSAMAHLHGARLPDDTQVVWNQGFFDAILVYDIRSRGARISLHPYFTALAPRVLTSVHLVLSDGGVRTFELSNDPGLVHLDPTWFESVRTFASNGFFQILGGAEYLLLLVGLAIPARRIRDIVTVGASFTLACSAAMIAATFRLAPAGAWFSPFVAAFTAVAIVGVAIHNVFAADQRHRWILAAGCGLAFGFALSFLLQPVMQFAGDHPLTAVASFAVGGAVAQWLVLAALVPPLTALFRIAVSERMGVAVISALVGHTAWHSMVARVNFLTMINWSQSDLMEMMRWGMATALATGAAVVVVGFGRHFRGAHRRGVPAALGAAADEQHA